MDSEMIVDSLPSKRKVSWARVVATVLLVLVMVLTLVTNGLSGAAIEPFTNSMANISEIYNICYTPAGFTFSIWSVIYACLVVVVLYSISLLFRKKNGEPLYTMGGAVSLTFLLLYTLDLALSVAWLFVWHSELLAASAAVLVAVAVINVVALTVAAHNLKLASSELLATSKVDFWFGVFTVNGYGIYTTWTCLASMINIGIFLIYQLELDPPTVCVTVLSVIPVAFVAFAILEAFVFVKIFNVLATPYFVYLWASYGIYQKNQATASEAVFALFCTNLGVAAALCLARVITVIYRNRKGGVYSNSVQDISATSLQDKRY